MTRIALLSLILLTACGREGPPVRPGAATAPPPDGISVSGDARVGVITTF